MKPIIGSPGKRATPGTWRIPRAARAEVKLRRLPRDVRRAELAATAADRFACPPIFAEFADSSPRPAAFLLRDIFRRGAALFPGSALSAPWLEPSRMFAYSSK